MRSPQDRAAGRGGAAFRQEAQRRGRLRRQRGMYDHMKRGTLALTQPQSVTLSQRGGDAAASL
jgi:hypothetical protein